MENSNYKKYMKIFGMDRFSVKLGNFLAMFSVISFILGIVLAICGYPDAIVTCTVGLIPLFTIGIILGNLLKPKQDDLNIFIKKDNSLYFLNTNLINIPNEMIPFGYAMTFGASKGVQTVSGAIGLISQYKKIKELYRYLRDSNFDEPRYLDTVNRIAKTQVINETPSSIKVIITFETKAQKEVTIYNNYNDYQELVSLIKSMS